MVVTRGWGGGNVELFNRYRNEKEGEKSSEDECGDGCTTMKVLT